MVTGVGRDNNAVFAELLLLVRFQVVATMRHNARKAVRRFALFGRRPEYRVSPSGYGVPAVYIRRPITSVHPGEALATVVWASSAKFGLSAAAVMTLSSLGAVRHHRPGICRPSSRSSRARVGHSSPASAGICRPVPPPLKVWVELALIPRISRAFADQVPAVVGRESAPISPRREVPPALSLSLEIGPLGQLLDPSAEDGV